MKRTWNLFVVFALLAMLVGANVAPAQAQEPQTYSISGSVFNDYDGDATWESDEPGLGSAFIQLDGSCNGAEYGTPYTYSAEDGSYSFTGVPAGQSYCFLIHPISGTWLETIVPQITSLNGDMTAVNIGLTTSWLVLNPSAVPDAQLGEYYFQQFAISGGTGPITLGGTYTMPDGMAFYLDGRTLTLSGTPTESGLFGDGAKVADSAVPPHEYTWLNFEVYGDAEFNLTADPNPSAEGQMVSFTFSASDPNSTVQFPYGLVTFFADGTAIAGCTNLYLNVVGVGTNPTFGDFPAVCATSTLAAGTHAIRADFTSSSLYPNASLTLACGQTVGTALHCISGAVFNDKDADGVYDPGTGGPEDEYGLSNVPVAVDVGCDGIFAPDEPATQTASDGTFGFSLPEHGRYCITAELETGWARTTPGVVEIADLTGPAIVNFGMQHLELHFSPQVFPDATLGVYYNETMTVTDGVGPYTFGGQTTDYWPAPGLTWEFNPTTGALTLSGTPTTLGNYGGDWAITDSRGVEGWPDLGVWVNMNLADTISGKVFDDANTNGAFDTGEPGLSGVTVQLDQSCDQSVNTTVITNTDGSYTFTGQEPGLSYCVWSETPAGYKLTLYPAWIQSLDADMTGMDFGFTNLPLFTWTPTTPDEGGTATFTAVAGFMDYAWKITQPGADCITEMGTIDQQGQSVELSFGASGQYQVCMVMTNAAGWPIYDGQLVTVANVAPVAFDGAISIYPEPSLAGSPILAAEAAFYDWDHLAECTVDYGDGTGPQAGTIPLDENACAGPAHTYTAAGTYTVTFTATDPDGATGTATATHAVNAPVLSADLSLTKTDSKDPVKPGAQLVYTLTVSNLGPDTAETLTLVDTLDRNTKYVSTSAPRGWACSYANYAVTCTRTSLASGSSAIIKITVTVNKAAKPGKELVNNATVSSAINDPILTNNTVVQKTLVTK